MRQAWGRLFSRNPQTGLKRISAEVFTAELPIRQPLVALQQAFPEAVAQLQLLAAEAERQLRDAVVLEFEVDSGELRCQNALPLERTAQAACKIAVALVQEELLSREEAIFRVDPHDLRALLVASLEDSPEASLYRGQSRVPGVASGRIVLSAAAAVRAKEPVILLCERLTYVERDALHRLDGLIIRAGSSLAAGHYECPCVLIPDCNLNEGQWVTMDATTGQVYDGDVPMVTGSLSADAEILLEWTDAFRRVEVRANVANLEEARLAPFWGAQGVGLFRIESLFLVPHRLPLFQTVLRQICCQELSASPAYDQIVSEVSEDVAALLEAAPGPFNVRLLDAPLSQMLGYWRDSGELPEDYFSGTLGVWIQELNPMQGLRCGRLSLLYPRLMEIQLRAVLRAWGGRRGRLQVMMPGVCDAHELRLFRRCLAQVAEQEGAPLPEIGSMLEIPRACLLAEELAEEVDFLAFGTGDLTESTCGMSRYDSPLSFLPAYLEQSVFERDPFESLDQGGVGALMRWACRRVQSKCPSVEMGTVGAQAVDPKSLDFCVGLGLKYVSVPVRHLPVARLAAAQASLRPGSPRQQVARLHRS